MKIVKIFAVFALLSLSSCEKPQGVLDEDSDEKTSEVGTGSNPEEDGENGGWYESNPYYGKEYQNGDTVNVMKFAHSDFEGQVWVKGYVIGCATGSGGYSYQLSSPYMYETAILVGDSRWKRSLDNAVAIQLPSGSRIRKDLNLKSNPLLDGVTIAVKGEKTTYLKLPGMKKISAYEIVSPIYGMKQ